MMEKLCELIEEELRLRIKRADSLICVGDVEISAKYELNRLAEWIVDKFLEENPL